MVSILLGAGGCHQRAYNELYVENMATEIRLLEDRVYEYDAEYRALENELEDLRAVNEGLEIRLRDAERSFPQKSAAPTPAEPKPAAPKSEAAEPLKDGRDPIKRAPPKELLRSPSSEAIQLEVETPEPPPRKKPAIPESGELLPPTPEAAPSESLLRVPDRASHAPRGLPDSATRAHYEERRIAAPSLPPSSNSEDSPARASSQPGNARARQIEFHPGLCRGLKRDGDPSESGIALVLVPRNDRHEFVPVSGYISVVMEETSEGQVHRLGKWDYSAEETAELLEPVGSGQGIHLQVLWREHVPRTQLIDVYVRFTDDQGITMVNHRQIHLRKPSPGQSTWTPK